MIVTNDFVMLNFPKTGSTYAREMIKRIYSAKRTKVRAFFEKARVCRPRVSDIFCPKIDEIVHYKIKDQHGSFRQIPTLLKKRPIVSITRHPFSRYISTYNFRWWEKFPPADISEIQDIFPNFPDISFSEYYKMCHIFIKRNRLKGIAPQIDLGIHTIQFIQFYFPKPEIVLKNIDNNYIKSKQFNKEISTVKFLHQENLNTELKEFLNNFGFSQNELSILDRNYKINVTNKEGNNSSFEAIKSSIKEKILERDKLLFNIFPEYSL